MLPRLCFLGAGATSSVVCVWVVVVVDCAPGGVLFWSAASLGCFFFFCAVVVVFAGFSLPSFVRFLAMIQGL